MEFVDNLTRNLHDFCAQETIGRDASHGVAHMDKVRENAVEIWTQERVYFPQFDYGRILSLVIAAAQLHDVADHKYGDVEARSKIVSQRLAQDFLSEDVQLLLQIMDKTSYSKEARVRKAGNPPPTWDELGEEGKLVRNIVSDADKLEAIGMIGIQRCLQYSHEEATKMNQQISANELLSHLVEHGEEKLLILKDDYFRTKTGKIMAEIPHNIMVEEIALLQNLQANDIHGFEERIFSHILGPNHN